MRRTRPAIHPLVPERWRDLVRLFGARGACGGCWCMWWRQTHAEFERKKGPANRRAMNALVRRGPAPGLLAYVGGEPAGWCCVGPRDTFPRLARSRILAPVDDAPVWSVVCFFVAAGHRGRGLTVQLLEAAKIHARRGGGHMLEGYPVEPKRGRAAPAFVYTGLLSAFRKAGFTEVARRSATRPIMRCPLD